MRVKKKRMSGIMSLLAAAALTVSSAAFASIDAFAENGAAEAVKQNQKGLIKVECVYGDDDTPIASYSGFLVNESNIVTCKDVYSGNLEGIMVRENGQNFKFDSSKVKYKVKISGAYIYATTSIGTKQDDNDFAVLTLSHAITLGDSGYQALTLGDSNTIDTTQTVYSIGFSSTNSNTTIVSTGEVAKVTNLDGRDGKFEYNMNNPTDGYIGSPVVDTQGSVVGLTYSITNDGFIAVPINSVKNVLTTFSITYTEGPAVTPQPQPQPEPSSPPESSIEQSSALNSKEPSENSDYQSESEESSDVEVPDGANTTMIIIIIGIGVVVVAMVVVMIIIAVKNKPKAAPVNTGNVYGGNTRSMPTPSATPQSRPSIPAAPQMSQPQIPQMPKQPPVNNGFNGQFTDGGGETTVLSPEGAGETTILGGSAAGVPSGVLVNVKTNDRIIVNKPEFAIGKERSRVDYCIANNNSVSRLHLKIRVRAGKCFVVDMGSKNGTFINNQRLTPNQETPINSGDRLRISDEEFEFKG